MKKTFKITYKNGKSLLMKAYDVSKEGTGYLIWNGLNDGITYIKGECIDSIKEVVI